MLNLTITGCVEDSLAILWRLWENMDFVQFESRDDPDSDLIGTQYQWLLFAGKWGNIQHMVSNLWVKLLCTGYTDQNVLGLWAWTSGWGVWSGIGAIGAQTAERLRCTSVCKMKWDKTFHKFERMFLVELNQEIEFFTFLDLPELHIFFLEKSLFFPPHIISSEIFRTCFIV